MRISCLAASAILRRWLSFEVTITSSSRRTAPSTTAVSTTSSWFARPASSPTRRAWSAVIGSTSQPAIMRARLAWRGPPLQASAKTGAGTTGITSSAMKAMCKAHIRRSFRSPAMRAPVSYVTPATQADRFADERPRSSRARARPSASSFSVRGPASASHAATPRRPASRRRRREAVSVIQALKVEPDSVAASSIALANSEGNDTDRLSRCAIDRMVAQPVGQSAWALPAHQPRSQASPELTGLASASQILDQLRHDPRPYGSNVVHTLSALSQSQRSASSAGRFRVHSYRQQVIHRTRHESDSKPIRDYADARPSRFHRCSPKKACPYHARGPVRGGPVPFQRRFGTDVRYLRLPAPLRGDP